MRKYLMIGGAPRVVYNNLAENCEEEYRYIMTLGGCKFSFPRSEQKTRGHYPIESVSKQ